MQGIVPGDGEREQSTLASCPYGADDLAACYTDSIALWQGPNEEVGKKLL